MKPRGGEGQNGRLKCPMGFLVENKLDKTTEPDGALIYLKVFIKITVYRLGVKSISSCVRMICELIQIFMLFCKGELFTL